MVHSGSAWRGNLPMTGYPLVGTVTEALERAAGIGEKTRLKRPIHMVRALRLDPVQTGSQAGSTLQ